MKIYNITKEDKELIQEGLTFLEKHIDTNTYKHTVSAILKCKNGNIYKGINCDGIHGACAEYITMGIAISAGERDFDTIIAINKDYPNNVISPCGNCRQMLVEYSPNIKVVLNNYQNELIKVKIKDLIPFACL